MPRKTRLRQPKYPKMPRWRKPRMAAGTQYAMKRMVDMQTMAVGGMVGSGMIGMVGSLLP
jgi:hypothetical protein